jgi:carbonic anhydrase
VLIQIENLQTHPSVAVRLQRGDIALHAWVYKIETGDVFAYSQEEHRFAPLVVPSDLQADEETLVAKT